MVDDSWNQNPPCSIVLRKYIVPKEGCAVQYNMSVNGIMSGIESAQRATSDIDTGDPVLDGTSLIWGNLLVNH